MVILPVRKKSVNVPLYSWTKCILLEPSFEKEAFAVRRFCGRQSYLASRPSREVHWKVSITIYLEQTMCKKSSLSKSWNIRSQRSYNHKMHIPWNIRRSRKSIIQWCQLYSFILLFFSPYLECSLFFFSSIGFSWDVSETQIPSCLWLTQNTEPSTKIALVKRIPGYLSLWRKKGLKSQIASQMGHLSLLPPVT